MYLIIEDDAVTAEQADLGEAYAVLSDILDQCTNDGYAIAMVDIDHFVVTDHSDIEHVVRLVESEAEYAHHFASSEAGQALEEILSSYSA